MFNHFPEPTLGENSPEESSEVRESQVLPLMSIDLPGQGASSTWRRGLLGSSPGKEENSDIEMPFREGTEISLTPVHTLLRAALDAGSESLSNKPACGHGISFHPREQSFLPTTLAVVKASELSCAHCRSTSVCLQIGAGSGKRACLSSYSSHGLRMVRLGRLQGSFQLHRLPKPRIVAAHFCLCVYIQIS